MYFHSTLKELVKWEDENINKVNKKEKSVKIATDFRSLGNDRFLKKEYLQCYYFYTKSLLYAPLNHESYGLALSNRSAVFYEQEKYNVKFFFMPVFTFYFIIFFFFNSF